MNSALMTLKLYGKTMVMAAKTRDIVEWIIRIIFLILGLLIGVII